MFKKNEGVGVFTGETTAHKLLSQKHKKKTDKTGDKLNVSVKATRRSLWVTEMQKLHIQQHTMIKKLQYY